MKRIFKILYLVIIIIIIILVYKHLIFNTKVYKKKTSKNIKIEKNYKIGKKQLAIVIDDCGRNTKYLSNFLSLKIKLNFAVIPFLPNSKKTVEILKEHKMEVLLHMPMESLNNEYLNKKTKGILLVKQQDSILKAEFLKAIKNLGGNITGFNNHMGSKFTSNKNKMRVILKIAKAKNMFYLDSLTSKNAVGYKLAKQMGVKTYKRRIFLDNSKKISYIENQIKKAVKILNNGKSNYIIAIGHYQKVTANALKNELTYIKKHNIELVFIKNVKKF